MRVFRYLWHRWDTTAAVTAFITGILFTSCEHAPVLNARTDVYGRMRFAKTEHAQTLRESCWLTYDNADKLTKNTERILSQPEKMPVFVYRAAQNTQSYRRTLEFMRVQFMCDPTAGPWEQYFPPEVAEQMKRDILLVLEAK